MGKKIFVSYKYADALVAKLSNTDCQVTVRDYVDYFQGRIADDDHIYKGENDGESMETLEDSTIASKLGDKIFDSTITIVFISKGMKENVPDKEQWIPWEISYSLREQSRQGRTSKTNAMLGVVLPDENKSYDYYYRYNSQCNSTTHFTNQLFDILRKNMFNLKNPQIRTCNGTNIHEGEPSFIKTVKWDAFINNTNLYINKAVEICNKRDEYEICKTI
ncbi:TIR domain-containing protein [Cytophagaceae bacterium DM2B3-1]|uniref:TIR domain-containing protein n=1 Tax=Xanthocytophaga flava TaxID=3048013 RepID=A0ABT7CXD5_9BACT|nr:TIR domain-containing protein [Xanthocytophaga flavus]MDJ1498407.1 TIR domain-containing protein [Xanthocytophaga flavus]